jgi:hypothetical protein
LAKAVQSGTGTTGAFRRDVELKGSIQCDTPLTSEVAKLPCVYYSMYVTREYDEVYTETNPDTKQPERKTRRKSDTVASNTRILGNRRQRPGPGKTGGSQCGGRAGG